MSSKESSHESKDSEAAVTLQELLLAQTVLLLARAQQKTAIAEEKAAIEQSKKIAAETAAAEHHELSKTDSLTRLGNRRAFEAAHAILPVIRPSGERASDQGHYMLLIDVDYFKTINDSQGHAAGDMVLQTVADVLVSKIRTNDLATRFGGDEFAVLLPFATEEKALEIAENTRATAEENAGIPTTLSIGVTEIFAGELDENLRRADVALYEAKHNGRNQVTYRIEPPLSP